MSTALMVQDQQALSRWEEADMVQTLKDTVCRGASDSQFRMFVEICKATGLNPLLKEIWFVPSVGIIAARDGYLRVANEHPQFDGMETRVERDAQGIPIKAVCSVWRKDRSHPVTCEAYYNEYKKAGNVWGTYKSAMISKVAEVLALKRSFSINGVVTEEEVGFETPEPPRGSKETQGKVAARKIEQLSAGATQAEAAAVVEAEFVEELGGTVVTESAGEETVAKSENPVALKAMLDEFQDIKKVLGESDYYAILERNGFKKSNQIWPLKRGRDIYKQMAARVKELKVRAGFIDQFEELAQKHGADEVIRCIAARGFEKPNEIPTPELARIYTEVQDELRLGI